MAVVILKTLDKISEQLQRVLPVMEGWCDPLKAIELARSVLEVRPKLCLDIGVFGGRSLVAMALAVKELGEGKVIGIDPWNGMTAIEGMLSVPDIEWWKSIPFDKIKQDCVTKIAELGLVEFVELRQARSQDIVGEFLDGSIGIIHMDGNHSEEASLANAIGYLPKLQVGGYCFFNDIRWTEEQIVTQHKAVVHFMTACTRVMMLQPDCLVLRKT